MRGITDPDDFDREWPTAGAMRMAPKRSWQLPFDQTYPECGRTCVELIERTIEAEDPSTVAAVIVEYVPLNSAPCAIELRTCRPRGAAAPVAKATGTTFRVGGTGAAARKPFFGL
jgi:hypothetical protein